MTQHAYLERLTAQERQVLQAFVERLRQRFDGQLLQAVLYGSRARGQAGPDSDMDVLVVLTDAPPKVREEVRHLAAEVWLEYGIYLSTRVWSQAHRREMEGVQTGFYRNIRREGLDLL